jgi:GNAT superfamily N-acetyltransferase
MATLRITEEAEPDPASIAVISDGLNGYNQPFAGPYIDNPLWLFARDRAGAIKAGLKASTHLRWLYVDWLWVEERYRRSGVGSELLRQAEATAARRGCVGAYLNTFSFQGPAFYPGRGYVEVGRIEGFPPGHSRIWFSKPLTPPS